MEFDYLLNPDVLVSLITLTLMEIVLGIDNIVFIAIICSSLPKEQQSKGRNIGLILALGFRVGLLFLISWLATLTAPLFIILSNEISGRDLILLCGGLFLLYKATREIFHKLEESDEEEHLTKYQPSFTAVIGQIIIIDVVFSLDSIITAVGLVSNVWIMITAVVLSMFVMLAFSGKISHFIEKHPSLKLLALSFLLVIGTLLVAESFDVHVPKGYVYFAMAFSLAVEAINIRYRNKRKNEKKTSTGS